MTLAEARQVLGVADDAPADVVRRSYLKLLKQYKPETDPEGFARVRTAFEVVKAAAEGEAAPRTSAEQPLPEDEAAPTGPLDAFRREFQQLAGDAPPQAMLDIARRAVAALPDEPQARTWLVTGLVGVGDEDGAVAALRDAYLLGQSAFLVDLARRFPERLTDAELGLLTTATPPTFVWGLTSYFLDCRDLRRAGVLARLAFQAASQPAEGPPPPKWVFALLLQLHAYGQLEQARSLTQAYAAWVALNDLIPVLHGPELEPTWMRLQELAALGDAVPLPFRIWLVEVMSSGADADASRWPRMHPRLFAAGFAATEQAPAIRRLLDQRGARPAKPTVQPVPFLQELRKHWLLVAACLGVTLVVVVPPALQGMTISQFIAQQAPEDLREEHMRQSLARVCRHLDPAKRAEVCSRLTGIVDSSRHHICSRDPEWKKYLQGLILGHWAPSTGADGGLPADATPIFKDFMRALDALCAGP